MTVDSLLTPMAGRCLVVGADSAAITAWLPRRMLDAGLAGGRLPRSGGFEYPATSVLFSSSGGCWNAVRVEWWVVVGPWAEARRRARSSRDGARRRPGRDRRRAR